jgi:GT2 family glycosyltransferase
VRARVLLAVLVYGGPSFVPRCLRSAARAAATTEHDVDVLVLDDCSPDADWSAEIRQLCASLGIGFYRSPRNLGIPRNMNLGLLRGLQAGYDAVVIANSDMVFPADLVPGLVAAASSVGSYGSVTAWSNNVSIFSLPNADPDRHLVDVHTVDWVSRTLGERFGDGVLPIPVGVGCCLMLATDVVREVGLFDPVFGRGYCEEVDLCLRAAAAGHPNVLALGTFVYHEGNASTKELGLLAPGHSTVIGHERIIDHRYPGYRQQVQDFLADDGFRVRRDEALARLVVDGAAHHGWTLDVSALQPGWPDDERAQLRASGEHPGVVRGRFRGFEQALPVTGSDMLGDLVDRIGRRPERVRVAEHSALAEGVVLTAGRSGVPTEVVLAYPERTLPLPAAG